MRTRPEIVESVTIKRVGPNGKNIYITIGSENDIPIEIFIIHGKAGSDASAYAEWMGRTISKSLQLKDTTIEVQEYLQSFIETSIGIQGANTRFEKGDKILSIPDTIAKGLAKYYEKLYGMSYLTPITGENQ